MKGNEAWKLEILIRQFLHRSDVCAEKIPAADGMAMRNGVFLQRR
jgi:hypothetical protein